MKKEDRIKKSEEIAELVKKKQRVYSNCFTIYYNGNVEKTRAAISVSKKYGTAVERNYAKRVVREIIDKVIHKYVKMDIVVVVKNDLRKEKFENLIQEMDNLLLQIQTKLERDEISRRKNEE